MDGMLIAFLTLESHFPRKAIRARENMFGLGFDFPSFEIIAEKLSFRTQCERGQSAFKTLTERCFTENAKSSSTLKIFPSRVPWSAPESHAQPEISGSVTRLYWGLDRQ